MWPGLSLQARFIYYVVQYAIEAEIDCMNEDDIEECVAGMDDELINWYHEVMDQSILNQLQEIINGTLDLYYLHNPL